MSPADSSVERATLRRIWRELATLKRFAHESDERLGPCGRCGCFTAAFWMRFIACPSRPHAVKAELCLVPDLHRRAQQTWQVVSSCHPPALAERGPILHELPALFEKVASAVGGLDRVADSVGEGLLYDVVRVGGRLGGPVSEGAAKAMDRYIALLHLLQHVRHGHVTQAGSGSFPNEHM